MNDDQEHKEEDGGWIEALKRRSAVPIGIIGLVAWLVLLWYMFGDVL